MTQQPAKFVKKPVVIEAMPFDGTYRSGVACIQWMDQGQWWLVKFVDGPEPGMPQVEVGEISITTPEGVMTASPGDWIIKGVSGEFYPCKPDIFTLTYEPYTEESETAPEPDPDPSIDAGFPASHPRHMKHYCRQCPSTFEPSSVPTLGLPLQKEVRLSAHTQALMHVRRVHDTVYGDLSCGRYCKEKAQPEEIKAGKKLYGPGSVSPTEPIMTYDALFPTDEDHT